MAKAKVARPRRARRRLTWIGDAKAASGFVKVDKRIMHSRPVLYGNKIEFELLPDGARAEVYAGAIIGTTDRYLKGLIKEPTWKAHLRHLWCHAEERKVAALVKAILNQGAPK